MSTILKKKIVYNFMLSGFQACIQSPILQTVKSHLSDYQKATI